MKARGFNPNERKRTMLKQDPTVYALGPEDALVVSIVVLFVGAFINRKVRFLSENFIPPAVTGGLICSLIVWAVRDLANAEISFDLQIRDVLLLVFFSTIGLSATLRTLAAGGKALAILVVIAAVFLVLQDVTGVLLATLFGVHPGYGLMGGSVSFAGGHGTAIAWGQEAVAAGLEGAGEVGIAFATFGLIAGGLIGGPIGGRLISKYGLRPEHTAADGPESTKLESSKTDKTDAQGYDLYKVLLAILVLTICVELGILVNRFLFSEGVVLPGFLTSMAVGIVIANFADLLRLPSNQETLDKMGDVSLNIFLAMSLMSMKLWTLGSAASVIMVVLMVQVIVMTFFAMYVVFRAMGRDYDAAVITAGFAGLGLGATPVAIANMNSITSKFGPSAKAFLIVPLVGAFFIDLLNAVIIKFFIGMI
jgi:ESS family glutamate:Na+ symporter